MAFSCSGIASNQELFRGILLLRYCRQSRALPRHSLAQVLPGLPPIKSSSAAFSCSGIAGVAANQELFRGILLLRYCRQSRALPRHSLAQILPPIKSSSAACSCAGIAANPELFGGLLVRRYCRQSRALRRLARAQVLPPIKSTFMHSRAQVLPPIKSTSTHSRAQVLPPSAAYSCSGIASNQELFRRILVLRYCHQGFGGFLPPSMTDLLSLLAPQ